MERDRQALQTLVELGAQVVLDLRRRTENEPAPRPDHHGLEKSEAEHDDGAPHDLPGVPRRDRARDDDLQGERDREGQQACDEGADAAQHEAPGHRAGERNEARQCAWR